MLWDAGLVNAAVQLETRWTELGREYAFSLFCGYPARALPRATAADAFAEVCRLHGEFEGHRQRNGRAPPGGATCTFAFSRYAPAAARHFAVGTLRRLGRGGSRRRRRPGRDRTRRQRRRPRPVRFHRRPVRGRGYAADLGAGREPAAVGAPGAALSPAPLHGLGAVDALAARWGVESLGEAGKTRVGGPAPLTGPEAACQLPLTACSRRESRPPPGRARPPGHQAEVAAVIDVQPRVPDKPVHQPGVGQRDDRVVVPGEDERRLAQP